LQVEEGLIHLEEGVICVEEGLIPEVRHGRMMATPS